LNRGGVSIQNSTGALSHPGGVTIPANNAMSQNRVGQAAGGLNHAGMTGGMPQIHYGNAGVSSFPAGSAIHSLPAGSMYRGAPAGNIRYASPAFSAGSLRSGGIRSSGFSGGFHSAGHVGGGGGHVGGGGGHGGGGHR
jgi:hypothetical protein